MSVRESASGLTGSLHIGSREVRFETRHVGAAESAAVIGRVLDAAGEPIAADVRADWPTTPVKAVESYAASDFKARGATMALLPSLERALSDAHVRPEHEADLARLVALTKLGGRPATRTSSLHPLDSFSKTRDANYWYSLIYEIHKKPAFVDVSVNPLEHSAMLVWNEMFDGETGEESTAAYYVFPGNRGATADQPSMEYVCNKFVPDRWTYAPASTDECPGTNGDGRYGFNGVCNNSTYFQKLVLEGHDYYEAHDRACGFPRDTAPSCDE